jgi:DNA-binding beta-propeller fold protein YncE
MRLTLLLVLALALAQPPPPGFYAPSAGQLLPCTCPAACPAVRGDYSVDATLSGAHSIWTVNTLAGSGGWSGSDVNGQGQAATFNNPSSLAADFNASTSQLPPQLFVFDFATHTLRGLSPGGAVNTLAGPGTINTFGYVDSATPSAVRFNQPRQGVRTPSGLLYIAGGNNHAIRQVHPNGTTGTLSGNGTAGFRNGPLLQATFSGPCGLAMDAAGALYVSDTLNHAMRLVSGGVVSTLAGNGTAGSANGIGSAATFNTPYTVAVTPSGSVLYVADRLNNRIRRVTTATRLVATIAGNGTGSTVIARRCVGSACTFANPVGIALLPSGMLVVVELLGHRVRLLNPATGLTVLLAG